MQQSLPKTNKKSTPSLGQALTRDDLINALWWEPDLCWKLWPQQEDLYHAIRALPDNVETVVVLCSRQIGKSYMGVCMALEDCIRYKNKCILIIGPTIKQTVEIVAPRIAEIAKDSPRGLIKRSKSESKWYVGRSELVIGGFDISSSSQRGKTVQNIYIEEVVDSNPDQYNESMRSDLGPALTRSKGGKMIFLTTPPKIPDHPFIQETIPLAKLKNAFYKYTIYDDKMLTKEQFDACVERSGGIDTVDFQREYLCEIVRDERVTVLPSFNKELHIRPTNLPEHFIPEITLDWGGIRDNTHAILHTYDWNRNMFMVMAEKVYQPNTPTKVIVDECRTDWEKKFKIHSIWADVPGQIQVDLINDHKFMVQIPQKTDFLAAVQNLDVMFRQNLIEIDPSCKMLIATCDSGQFNKQRTDFARTSAFGHCDGIAALMYAVRMRTQENPWPVIIPNRMYTHFNEKDFPKNDKITLAQSIVPKVFNNVGIKKFGTLR